MAEYICREELIKALETDYNRSWCSKPQGVEEYVEGARDEYDDVLKIVSDMKSADVQPVKRGEWVKCGKLEGKIVMKCSVCEQGITEKFAPKYHYCPNCGARMIKDGDIND